MYGVSVIAKTTSGRVPLTMSFHWVGESLRTPRSVETDRELGEFGGMSAEEVGERADTESRVEEDGRPRKVCNGSFDRRGVGVACSRLALSG